MKETIERTPTGLEKRYVYNNRKDLVSVVEKDLITGEVREQKNIYDKRHLLIQETDNVGNITRYAYRDDSALIRKEQGPWHFEYKYEAGGRIASVTKVETGTNKNYTENYGYKWQGWNEERTVTSEAGTTVYQFDHWGRITAITNAHGETSSRTLNSAGNVLREQRTDGGLYEYKYDALGRPYRVDYNGVLLIQVQYNLNGDITEKTDRLGNRTQYTYDGRGLLVKETTASQEECYYYDDASRLIRHESVSKNSVVSCVNWNYNDSQRTITITAGGGKPSETLYLNAW